MEEDWRRAVSSTFCFFLNVMPHVIYFLHRRLITRKRSTRTRKRKRIWNSSCLRRAARLRLRRTRSIRSKRREFY
jgi:hypothetical protein